MRTDPERDQQAFARIAGGKNGMAFRCQHAAQVAEHVRIVIDQQDAQGRVGRRARELATAHLRRLTDARNFRRGHGTGDRRLRRVEQPQTADRLLPDVRRDFITDARVES